MDSRAVCETVIKRLNGIVLPGSTEQLRVKFANGPSPRKFNGGGGKNKYHQNTLHAMPQVGPYGGPYGVPPGGFPGMIPGQFMMPGMGVPHSGGVPSQQWANGGAQPMHSAGYLHGMYRNLSNGL